MILAFVYQESLSKSFIVLFFLSKRESKLISNNRVSAEQSLRTQQYTILFSRGQCFRDSTLDCRHEKKNVLQRLK